MTVFIAFPARSYEASLGDMYRAHDWLLANKLKGDPEITGALIKPRYKGKALNVKDAAKPLLDSPYWRSGVKLEFHSDDALNYFRDLEPPKYAEVI